MSFYQRKNERKAAECLIGIIGEREMAEKEKERERERERVCSAYVIRGLIFGIYLLNLVGVFKC